VNTSAETTPETVLLAFNEAINTRDLPRADNSLAATSTGSQT
jgi:hypothetical protein